MKKNIGMNNDNKDFKATLISLMNTDEKIKMLVSMLHDSEKQFGVGGNNPMYDFINQKIEEVVASYMKRQTIIKERADIFNCVFDLLVENYDARLIGMTTAEIVTKDGIFNVKVSATNTTAEEKIIRKEKGKKFANEVLDAAYSERKKTNNFPIEIKPYTWADMDEE